MKIENIDVEKAINKIKKRLEKEKGISSILKASTNLYSFMPVEAIKFK